VDVTLFLLELAQRGEDSEHPAPGRAPLPDRRRVERPPSPRASESSDGDENRFGKYAVSETTILAEGAPLNGLSDQSGLPVHWVCRCYPRHAVCVLLSLLDTMP
jgi:hypothetical protein